MYWLLALNLLAEAAGSRAAGLKLDMQSVRSERLGAHKGFDTQRSNKHSNSHSHNEGSSNSSASGSNDDNKVMTSTPTLDSFTNPGLLPIALTYWWIAANK